jgi:hypothetical protein
VLGVRRFNCALGSISSCQRSEPACLNHFHGWEGPMRPGELLNFNWLGKPFLRSGRGLPARCNVTKGDSRYVIWRNQTRFSRWLRWIFVRAAVVAKASVGTSWPQSLESLPYRQTARSCRFVLSLSLLASEIFPHRSPIFSPPSVNLLLRPTTTPKDPILIDEVV